MPRSTQSRMEVKNVGKTQVKRQENSWVKGKQVKSQVKGKVRFNQDLQEINVGKKVGKKLVKRQVVKGR